MPCASADQGDRTGLRDGREGVRGLHLGALPSAQAVHQPRETAPLRYLWTRRKPRFLARSLSLSLSFEREREKVAKNAAQAVSREAPERALARLASAPASRGVARGRYISVCSSLSSSSRGQEVEREREPFLWVRGTGLAVPRGLRGSLEAPAQTQHGGGPPRVHAHPRARPSRVRAHARVLQGSRSAFPERQYVDTFDLVFHRQYVVRDESRESSRLRSRESFLRGKAVR